MLTWKISAIHVITVLNKLFILNKVVKIEKYFDREIDAPGFLNPFWCYFRLKSQFPSVVFVTRKVLLLYLF